MGYQHYSTNHSKKRKTLLEQIVSIKVLLIYYNWTSKSPALIHIEQENCGTILRDDNQFDNRISSGIFMFAKENFEDLKTVPITLLRIKYLTDAETI
jgi:hypothetical protein